MKSSDSTDTIRRERRTLIIENERINVVLAKHGIGVGQQRRMSGFAIDPNLNYLLSLFIAKVQVSVDVDHDIGLLVLSTGNKGFLSNALERMVL
ncbi:MAG TPA: hypothetical protein VE954_24725 [Oligoflexus sp.]|uniref:hypothetical protein n=1 Tax=Oligoflexus sp. TaxID=1971216 RepID=UPI002D6B95A7|nr:hypothetical protein [Oligoflexus sp.]HYX36322.1 hypothetical protein [Oligoflexus sp.]